MNTSTGGRGHEPAQQKATQTKGATKPKATGKRANAGKGKATGGKNAGKG